MRNMRVSARLKGQENTLDSKPDPNQALDPCTAVLWQSAHCNMMVEHLRQAGGLCRDGR
jgi:hypothetical protein